MLTVMNPVAAATVDPSGGARRIDDLAGKRVALWWNGKPGGDAFLDEVGTQLAARHPGMRLVRVWEHRPTSTRFYGVPKDDIAFMAANADLVIGALGD